MNQSISTVGKATTNKPIYVNVNKKKSTISFKLHIPHYRQDRVSIIGKSYIVELSRTSNNSRCPACGCLSQSLHGHYIRQLQGSEIFNHSLTLLVKTRKFRCLNKHCLRKVFSEDHSCLASPYGRNTLEVEERIREVSLKTTSRIASALLYGQNILCSQSACLRIAHKELYPKNRGSLPVAIGIDDFAQKKGHVYGSVIVDQMTHRPIAVLPCREGDELEQFLRDNPQIQYITRDRGRNFVEAINRTLPGVTQICDRFHLIKNMVDALTEEIASLSRLSVHKQTYSYPSMEECRAKIMEALYGLGDARHRHKLNLFVQADSCIRKGMSITETARQLGVHSQVIWRLVRHHTGKDYMSDQQKSILKHVDDLALEISHGCTDIKKLKKKMGSKMDAIAISAATIGIRNKIKQEQQEIRKYNKNIAERKNKKHASIRSIRKFILKGKTDVQSLTALLKNPSIKQVITLGLRFREMVNGNIRQWSLENWIKQAMESDSKAMRAFACGIKADQQAVQNAMDIYLNNGLLEGTVNKIKAIKRQMFNRASYRLLNVKLIAFKT
jgi:transposase